MKITFTKSLIVGLGIIFGANVWHVIENSPPNRIALTLFVTTILVGLYALLFALISKILLQKFKHYYFIIIFNTIWSFLFLMFYGKAQFYFQDNQLIFFFMHIGYVTIAPYILLIGLGLPLYVLLVFFLKRIKRNT